MSLGLDRRRALWAVRGVLASVRRGLDLAPPTAPAALPSFPTLGAADEIGWDYRASLHSVRGHPMERLRPSLRARRVPDAATLNAMGSARSVTYVGMVICRQQPGTASGVTFMTLEDETGLVNLVVWKQVFERCELIARTAAVLEVRGRLENEQGVVHLIAEQLLEPARAAAGAVPRSRNFH